MKKNVRYGVLFLIIFCIAGIIEAGLWRNATKIQTTLSVSPTISAFPDKYNNSFVQGGYVYLYDGDGGWNDVTPSGAIPNGSSARQTVNAALFSDQNTGWVVSVPDNSDSPSFFKVYRTTDGGGSWLSANVSVDWCGGVDMDFIDANNGWLLVHTGVACGSEGVSVMRTTDGGASWSTVSMTGLSGTPGCIEFAGDKTGIRFYDANNGWVTGVIATGGIYLYVTRDGGQNWQEQDIPTPGAPVSGTGLGATYAYYQAYPPVFYPNGHGVLPISEADCATSDNSFLGGMMYFYETDNSGADWILSSRITMPSITDGAISPLYCFLPNGKGYFTNGFALYSVASAKGRWNETVFNVPLSVIGSLYGPSKMIFTDENTGWLIPGGENDSFLLKSTDEGQYWSAIQSYAYEGVHK